MFVEMEQMASRPFSVVEVEIEKRNTAHSNQIPTISVSSNLRKRKIVSITVLFIVVMLLFVFSLLIQILRYTTLKKLFIQNVYIFSKMLSKKNLEK